MDFAQHRKQDQAYLLERWQTLFGQYDALKSAIEQQTVRDEWASGKRHDLAPLYFLRNSLAQGEIVDEQAANQAGVWWYRFDAGGRAIFECVYPTDQPHDTFTQYGEGVAEICQFMPYPPHSPLLIELAHLYYRGDQPIRRAALLLSGVGVPAPEDLSYSAESVMAWLAGRSEQAQVFRHEFYGYEHQRLTQIQLWDNSSSRLRENHETSLFIRYDASGQVQQIDAFDTGRRYRILHQHVPAGMTYDEIRARAETVLRTMIVTALRLMRFEQVISAVVLYWRSKDPFSLAPVIAVQFDTVRQDALMSGNASAIWRLNNSAQVLPYLSMQNDEVCRLFEQEAELRTDWFAVREVLRSVARELTRTKLLWTSDVFPITHDFAVYVLEQDYDLDPLHDALLVSVNEDQIARWREAGYLPAGA